MKKAVSVLLVATLMLGLCVPAFAAEEKKYTNYFCIGDSIPAGAGLEGYGYNEASLTTMGTAYPGIIRDKLGITGFSSVTHAGTRCAEICAALGYSLFNFDPSRYLDSYSNLCYDAGWGGEGAIWERVDGQKTGNYGFLINYDYTEALKNADLITINLGSNDVFSTLAYHILKAFDFSSPIELPETLAGMIEKIKAASTEGFDMQIEEAVNTAKAMGSAEEGAVYLLRFLCDICDSTEQFIELMQLLAFNVKENGLNEFLLYWDVMMGYIFDYVDNCETDPEVVVVGLYNPIKCCAKVALNMDEDSAALLSFLFQPLFDIVNYKMQFGSKYADRYHFVDVSAMGDVLAKNDHDEMGIHPGHESHQIMAEIILKSIGYVCPHTHSYKLFEVRPSIFHEGYTGDEFCADCGKQIKQGSVISFFGEKTDLPSALGYKLVRNLLTALVENIGKLFGSLITSLVTPADKGTVTTTAPAADTTITGSIVVLR